MEAKLSPSASRERSRLFVVAALLAVLWTLFLLVLAALKTNGLSRVVVSVGGLITVLVAVANLVADRFENVPFPRIRREMWGLVIVLALAVDCLASVGWAGWSYYEYKKPVDVTAHVTLVDNSDVRPGRAANFDLDLRRYRRRLGVVFRATDHRPDQGNCTSETDLEVTSVLNGNTGDSKRVALDTWVFVRLHPGTEHVHLSIKVINNRQDANCSVDLSVPNAVLSNG